ncbi:MAG: NAD-dependent epimerase/dehydratase family protein, partial [Proteobacteria bacterium]|nr:NAD-dependent epimerase/dehydratase family protein [Pseudomonadota bacterium]
MARILVTGATGFVGQTLCPVLRREDHLLTGTTRDPNLRAGPGNIPLNVIDDIGPNTDWSRALAGAEIVIHLAGRAHVMRDGHNDPAAEFHRVNVKGTQHLAAEAAKAGVKRFIFLSSIKVNGERTDEEAYRETDEPRPEDAYGISKRDAETALCEIASGTAMETVIIRPPLIYGPGAKGNLQSVLNA